MISNGNDISEKINMIVRNAVMSGIKMEFEPKLQKYLKSIADLIDIDILIDAEINLDGLQVATDNMVKEIIVKSIPVILAAIGGILAGPIGAIIGGALAIFVETIFKTKHEKEKREKIKQKVQGEIIPQIVEAAGNSVETELIAYVAQINEEIQGDIENQKNVLKKALDDIREQKKQEQENQKLQIEELQKDLEEIRGVLNGI